MRFTIITRFYHPTPEGIAHHSGYLYQYLIKAGHYVQVIYDDGIISLQPNEINLLVNKIKKQKTDWVIFQYNGYSYNRFGAPNWLNSFYKKINGLEGTKLCLIVHETFIREESNWKLRVYRYMQKRTLRIATSYADLILTTTHLYQQQLAEMKRKSELFFTPSNFENYIHELTINDDSTPKLVLGTFGNRNPDFLLNVLEILNNRQLTCQFHFIGNYQPKYIKAIKDFAKKFEFITISRSGKLTDKNIVQHLAKLNAFILLEPVREDGGGGLNTKSGASATALCMGIPIFSTKGDFTTPAVFKENKNYILLDHHDVVKSSEIIYDLVTKPEKLVKIGIKAKELYEQEFAWTRYVDKMLALMNHSNNG